jgi:hypothetical protein
MNDMRRLAALVAAGLALGAGTQLLQSVLPPPLAPLANGLSPWLLSAFAAGALMPTVRWAAGAGPLLLFAALAGYYLLVQLRFGYGGSTSSLMLWGIGALVGGPVFGSGGWLWRHGDRPLVRGAAAGLAGGLVLMEAFYLPVAAGVPETAPGWVVVAVLLPLLLGRTARERLIGLAFVVPWAVAGGLGLAMVGVLQLVLLGR